MKLTLHDIARMTDLSLVKTDHTLADVEELARAGGGSATLTNSDCKRHLGDKPEWHMVKRKSLVEFEIDKNGLRC